MYIGTSINWFSANGLTLNLSCEIAIISLHSPFVENFFLSCSANAFRSLPRNLSAGVLRGLSRPIRGGRRTSDVAKSSTLAVRPAARRALTPACQSDHLAGGGAPVGGVVVGSNGSGQHRVACLLCVKLS
jgi:hypothetical protein